MVYNAGSMPLRVIVALNPLRWNLGSSVDLNLGRSSAETFLGNLEERLGSNLGDSW